VGLHACGHEPVGVLDRSRGVREPPLECCFERYMALTFGAIWRNGGALSTSQEPKADAQSEFRRWPSCRF
jgi:hypothetical protein